MDIILVIIIAAALAYALGYRLGTKRGRLESRIKEYRRGYQAGYDRTGKDLFNMPHQEDEPLINGTGEAAVKQGQKFVP